MHFITHRRFSWGRFSFSDPRNRPPNAKAIGKKRVQFQIEFLRRDFETPAKADHLQAVFVAIAREPGAFIATAFVETGQEKKGSRLYSFARYPLPRSKYWLGVPPVPAWMVWCGWPYADVLRASCRDYITAGFQEGFLMRRGNFPAALDEISGDRPVYPPEYSARLCEQTLSGRTHSIFPPEATALDPRTFDGPAKVLLALDAV